MRRFTVLLLTALLLAPGMLGAYAAPSNGQDDAEHETHQGPVAVLCHSLPGQAGGQHLHTCGAVTALLTQVEGSDVAWDGQIHPTAPTDSFTSPEFDPPERPPDDPIA